MNHNDFNQNDERHAFGSNPSWMTWNPASDSSSLEEDDEEMEEVVDDAENKSVTKWMICSIAAGLALFAGGLFIGWKLMNIPTTSVPERVLAEESQTEITTTSTEYNLSLDGVTVRRVTKPSPQVKQTSSTETTAVSDKKDSASSTANAESNQPTATEASPVPASTEATTITQATTTTPVTTTVTQPVISVPWKTAYAQVLRSYVAEHHPADMLYSLYDLNADGTMELLISEGSEEESRVLIYTFDGKESIFVGSTGNYGCLYVLPEENTIYCWESNQGYSGGTVFEMLDNALCETLSFHDNAANMASEAIRYDCNGTIVTEDTYNSVTAAFFELFDRCSVIGNELEYSADIQANEIPD